MMGYALRKSIECRLLDTMKPKNEPETKPELKPEYFDPEDYDEEGDPAALWIQAETTISQKLAQANTKLREPRTIEEIVPQIYLKYRKVFKKQASE
jgi:hypothetical protein